MTRFWQKLFKEDHPDVLRLIFFMNLIYATPSAFSKILKQDKYRFNPKAAAKSLLLKSYGLGSLLLIFIYFMVFLPIPFEKMPILLDFSLLLLLLINILQTFTFNFNVFYESHDVENYMVLPIKETTVFRAKIAVIAFATLQLSSSTLPVIFVFLLHLNRAILESGNMPAIIAMVLGNFLLSFLYFIGITAVVVIVNLAIMQGLTQTFLLAKFKTKMMTAFNILAIIASIGLILIIQSFYPQVDSANAFTGLSHFGPISWVLQSPISGLAFVLLLFLLVAYCIRRISLRMEGRFYAFIQAMQNQRRTQSSTLQTAATPQSSSKSQGFHRFFWTYHKSLLNEPTLITQSIFTPLLMPLILILSNLRLLKSEKYLDMLTMAPVGFAMTMALCFIVLVNIFPTSLGAVIFSLDRENYFCFKSLPIPAKTIFREKLFFVSLFNALPTLLLFLGFAFVSKLPLHALAAGSLVLILMSICCSANWMVYDLKHLLPDWQNISDLYYRSGRLLGFFLIFAAIFLANLIAFGLLTFLMMSQLLNRLALLIMGILAIFILVTIWRCRNDLK